MATLTGPGWEISGVSGIVFDKDGTIIDSHLYWGEIVKLRAMAVAEFYKLPPAAYNALCAFMGYDTQAKRLVPEGPVALVSRSEVIGALAGGLRSIGISPNDGELEKVFGEVLQEFNKDVMPFISILPGVEDLLRNLGSAGVRMALVTSDSVVSARQILQGTGLNGYFASIVGRETIPDHKNTGKPAALALREICVPACEAVAIGDAPVDSEMAMRSGMKAAVLVASGQIEAEILKRSSGFVLGSLSEIRVF